jgi:hypothetical protein
MAAHAKYIPALNLFSNLCIGHLWGPYVKVNKLQVGVMNAFIKHSDVRYTADLG